MTGSVHKVRGGDSQSPSKEGPQRVQPVRASALKEEMRSHQPPRQRRCQISILFHSRDDGKHLWSLFLDCGDDSNILSYIVGPVEHRRYGERQNIRLDLNNLRGKLPVANIRPEQVGIYRHLIKSSYVTVWTDWWLDSRKFCLNALTSLNTAEVIDVDMEDIEVRGDSPFGFGTWLIYRLLDLLFTILEGTITAFILLLEVRIQNSRWPFAIRMGAWLLCE